MCTDAITEDYNCCNKCQDTSCAFRQALHPGIPDARADKSPFQHWLHGSRRRWRKLEGSDPTTYEMILKVQALQRRLIGQTEAVAERELHIAEQTRSLAELKARLARQPGPEAVEQLGGMQARRSAYMSSRVQFSA